MDISGIYESTGGIYIPFARCEDIAETDITIKDRYRKFPYKSIVFDPANRGYYSVCVHYFIIMITFYQPMMSLILSNTIMTAIFTPQSLN